MKPLSKAAIWKKRKQRNHAARDRREKRAKALLKYLEEKYKQSLIDWRGTKSKRDNEVNEIYFKVLYEGAKYTERAIQKLIIKSLNPKK